MAVEIVLHFGTQFEVHAEGSFSDGSRVWLRAPSGFGKTTLFRVLAGVQEVELSDASTLCFSGRENSLRLAASERGIGWVPQGESLFPGFSVRQQLELPMKWRGVKMPERDALIRNQIDRFELEGILDTPVDRLSGGERSRVAIARACQPGVKLVLLDEPFAALDHSARSRMEKVLVRNFSDLHSPVLIVASHDPPMSQNFFTAVWQGSQNLKSSLREFSVVTEGPKD